MGGRRAPGEVRDAIVQFLSSRRNDAALSDIRDAVCTSLGDVPASSVRSYLGLNTPDTFRRTARGRYTISANNTNFMDAHGIFDEAAPVLSYGKSELFHADCFEWMSNRPSKSIHAVVTDPPYGLVEYSVKEQAKLREGRGGVWRIPPSFDGHQRSPLPRFTTLTPSDLDRMVAFFIRWGLAVHRLLVPGGHVLIASNPLVWHLVAGALTRAGFEPRGSVVRLVMTMRGGDRPKNAHEEFEDVSVMPRSMWEPWVLVRKPIDGRVQDNLRRWKTGGLRRVSKEKPFGDVIKSLPTQARERQIAPHPSLKPQSFLRQLVRAALPLGEGIVLDPFAGSGSTLAAAEAVGYRSVGIECDPVYVKMARTAIPGLAGIST